MVEKDVSNVAEWVEFAKATKIRSGRKLQPFIPYDYQIKLVEQVTNHYGTVVTKSRQLGATEVIANWMLWRAKDDPAFLGVVFSKSQDDTKNISKRVRLAIAGRSDIELSSNSLQDLQLKNGGRLVFRPSTENAGRGLESVSVILFDECAFVPGIESLYAAAMPSTEALGDAARIVILSTPNGQGNFYFQRLAENNGDRDVLKICNQVRAGEIEPLQYWTDSGGWCKFITHWKAHPVYSKQPDYLEQQRIKKRMTEAQVYQEYDLGFEVSTTSIFQANYIQRSQRATWEEPKPRHRYIAGIDTNQGGDDYFTVHIWDVTRAPYRLVAEYRQNRRTKDYNLAQSIITLEPYNPVCISVETNGGGALYLEEFVKLRSGWKWEGVCTTHTSKFTNTDRLVLLLERDQLEMPVGCALAEEMPHFVESNSGKTRTRDAESGWHDDTIMSSAVCFANLDDAGYSMSDLLAAIAA